MSFYGRGLLRGAATALVTAVVVWAARANDNSSGVMIDCMRNLRSSLYQMTASVAGALLGFVIAAAAILISSLAAPLFDSYRDTPHYQKLWACYRACLVWLGALTILSFVALVIDRDTAPQWYVTGILAGVLVASAIEVGACVHALNRVIAVSALPSKARGEGKRE